jgi:hypothetical protein
MELIMDPIVWRGLERLIVVTGAITFAYLGYRLFLAGIDKGPSKIEAETRFYKFAFSGVGPGLSFMAFGAIILVTALFTGGAQTVAPGEDTKSTQAAFLKDEAGDRLRTLWKPDGKTINKESEAKLKKWMKDNGIDEDSLTFFLTGARFSEARQKAKRDLGLAK